MILVGAGGHALSLAEFASEKIEGYLAKEENIGMPGQYFGDDSRRENWIEKGKTFHVAYIYSGLPRMNVREKLIETYRQSGAEFETLISPTAIITPNSKIGKGSAVMQGTIINRSKIGENCVLNSGAIIEHDCEIGDNTFIGPGAVVGGFTKIGRNCFIGLGAKVGNGLVIGDNITVAMGAVVSKNLIEPGIYHGNPLRLFKC
ncbi:MAG: NeuD/PglB/VioB family sugar acetyltransferase [Muribaculaceae bacterium]|nr:NeuD/PglB/VioB family sugar acetyltransferase [Muribaculaceae bacterium]